MELNRSGCSTHSDFPKHGVAVITSISFDSYAWRPKGSPKSASAINAIRTQNLSENVGVDTIDSGHCPPTTLPIAVVSNFSDCLSIGLRAQLVPSQSVAERQTRVLASYRYK